TADEMSLILMISELGRGHRESKRKSDAIGPAWRRKKDATKDGVILTKRLPCWIEVKDGKMVLIEEKAKTIKYIFELCIGGYGIQRIVRKLQDEGVPPLGQAGWERSLVKKILSDGRACGVYQRKGKGRRPDGDPVPSYFPAVVSPEEFDEARG